ncbi:HAAS signaling domain-containing protein [Microbacterium sp. NPDC055903]
MIDIDADRLRADYLARLDTAMSALPHGVAAEIRSGIEEELAGLDAAATAARIAQLGDPVAIAREAQDEVPATPVVVVSAPVAAPPAPRPPATTTRGFAIAAALTLSFGGIVVPFIGWVVGAVLVSLSPLWRTWEKAVAIAVPFVTATVSILIASSFSVVTAVDQSGSFAAPESNPLVPASYDLVWSGALVIGVLLIPASGLWLLWRLRGRTTR